MYVGALFLTVTATFFASDAIMTSLLDGPNYLADLAATIMLALSSLMLLSVAQDPNAAADTADTLGTLLTGTYDSLLPIVYIFSCTAGIMLSAALYSSRLVPRWLSLLGLVGLIPGGLFEFVLPLWLIAKGFNTQTINPTSAASEVSPG